MVKRGFVYVLEVKDIVLPVCKIGRTAKDPFQRCAEINQSSTGDFIWSVAHCVAVNDCAALESMVHSLLKPLRQKGREIFNINAEAAYAIVMSLVQSQSGVKEVESELCAEPATKTSGTNKKELRKNPLHRRIDFKYTRLFEAFISVLQVKGRPFGQLRYQRCGMCDGNEGVQWNVVVLTDKESAYIGVNLEGMKYKGWPISRFILSETDNLEIEEVKSKLRNPANVFIRFARDAWQVHARPNIVERYIGGKEVPIAKVKKRWWESVLKEALDCLDQKKSYLGRAKQKVTLEEKTKKGVGRKTMEVSPHLTIWSPLGLQGNLEKNIRNKIRELQPVYDWVKKASE